MAGEHIFLGEIEANPKPGPYADAIAAASEAGTEYWGIWNILAYHPMASHHLCELSHELMHKEAPISAALRELIAAYTSSSNQCDFCRNAHAAVAAHLYGDRDLVEGVLLDPKTSALAEKEKALLRFVQRLTLDPGSIAHPHIEALKQAGGMSRRSITPSTRVRCSTTTTVLCWAMASDSSPARHLIGLVLAWRG